VRRSKLIKLKMKRDITTDTNEILRINKEYLENTL
jgi:hypothetical protein